MPDLLSKSRAVPGTNAQGYSTSRARNDGMCLFLFTARRILGDGGADEIFQRCLINCVTFAEVNGARGFRVQPGVEQSFGVIQRSAFEKVEFDMILESASGNDIAFVRPYRSIPFPFFGDFRNSIL